ASALDTQLEMGLRYRSLRIGDGDEPGGFFAGLGCGPSTEEGVAEHVVILPVSEREPESEARGAHDDAGLVDSVRERSGSRLE
ncbi:hypothetical protein, partial [Bacillus cereus group sp. BC13]|uniref:hypothetical protein n=1 Tax=Bacillus cereus group sp. BC13 TaxID=3445347 RepID=UPI003F27B0FF